MPALAATDLSVKRLLEDGEQFLPVPGDLQELFPGHGIRRGSTLRVGDFPGATSLIMHILAAPLRAGSWAAVVGIPGFGAEAAEGLGIPLGRLALVPNPGTEWREVTAALLDSLDLVALAPSERCRGSDARKLSARARQRQSTLIICPTGSTMNHNRSNTGATAWPESADIDLAVADTEWLGLRSGHGRLRSRNLTITASGRRLPGHRRHARVSLGG